MNTFSCGDMERAASACVKGKVTQVQVGEGLCIRLLEERCFYVTLLGIHTRENECSLKLIETPTVTSHRKRVVSGCKELMILLQNGSLGCVDGKASIRHNFAYTHRFVNDQRLLHTATREPRHLTAPKLQEPDRACLAPDLLHKMTGTNGLSKPPYRSS